MSVAPAIHDIHDHERGGLGKPTPWSSLTITHITPRVRDQYQRHRSMNDSEYPAVGRDGDPSPGGWERRSVSSAAVAGPLLTAGE
jgi:hypothetical protein